MLYYQVAVLGNHHVRGDFLTYHSDEALPPGTLVSIPFSKKTINGTVVKNTTKPSFATKSLTKLPQPPVPTELIKLGVWMSDYYCCSLSSALSTILPTGVNKKRRVTSKSLPIVNRPSHNDPLTSDQISALTQISAVTSSKPVLLHGITGSGKTRIYIELAKDQLKLGKNVIVLVPEINLTPQMIGEFQSTQYDVVTLHSQQTESEKHQLWEALAIRTKPVIVIGPRSALFAPLANIGLIVVDECHDTSYKQDRQPKYDAVATASQLAKLHSARLILGSATPNVSLYQIALLKKWPIITLSQPITPISREIITIDQTDRENFTKNPYFSNQLLSAISRSLKQGHQSLIFYNRRGSARALQCSQCGWVFTCPHCHVPLVLHQDSHDMRCNLCNIIMPIPKSCPMCNNSNIKFSGYGTKRLEAELTRIFPEAKIARYDSDTPKADSLLHTYQKVFDKDIDIIVGTQMITKGLDLPKLSTLGIIAADNSLQLPDVFAGERTFQTLFQALGRIGRSGIRSQAIIQAYNLSHQALQTAINQDYMAFFKHELQDRETLYYPPRCYLMTVKVGYSTPEVAAAKLSAFVSNIKKKLRGINILGPAPDFHEHIGSKYYSKIIIRSTSRKDLQTIALSLPQNWQFDLDPVSLL